MLAGPLFVREWLSLPRRMRSYALRAAVPTLLLLILWTSWQALIGFDHTPTLGEIARFNATTLPLLAYTQFAVVLFAATLHGVSSMSIEKDRRTLVLLLVTRLTDSEIVFGKYLGAALGVASVVGASLPAFLLMALLGGVGFEQIAGIFAATIGAAVAGMAVGVLVATWREKTFQSLALSILLVGLFLLGVELAAQSLGPRELWERTIREWCACVSPLRALLYVLWSEESMDRLPAEWIQLGFSIAVACLLLASAVWGLRLWNPRGEPLQPAEYGEVGSQKTVKSRTVWDLPILWREVRTRAYGTRPVLIKLAYLTIVVALTASLITMLRSPDPPGSEMLAGTLAPVIILSLLLINAQSLTSMTNERDLKSFDLLLVTEITPSQFVFGKLAGAAFNSKEMIAAPLMMLAICAWMGGMTSLGLVLSSLLYLVLVAFASVLGMHAGLRYDTTRLAIAHSLGTMFLLFVGVLVCLYLIVISGRFEAQWASFVLFIVLGSIGLWISLSANAPSSAITLAATLAPVATFYCIMAFAIGDRVIPFLVASSVYSFATVAMLVPMLSEFDVATGRTTAEGS